MRLAIVPAYISVRTERYENLLKIERESAALRAVAVAARVFHMAWHNSKDPDQVDVSESASVLYKALDKL